MTGKGLREQFGRSSRARAEDSRIEVDRKGGEERPCSPSSAIRRCLAVAAGYAYMYFVAFLDSEGRTLQQPPQMQLLRYIIGFD
jgi:hypothetical protein